MLVFRAKCCNPIPGDDITGYITRGRGVAVHTKLCPNVQNLMYETERRITVEWGGESATTFPIQLAIHAKDRAGLLAEITAVISGAGSNIRNLESRPDRNNARIDASLEIIDRRQFETILANIRKISGVLGVRLDKYRPLATLRLNPNAAAPLPPVAVARLESVALERVNAM